MPGFTVVLLRDSYCKVYMLHSQRWPTGYTPSKGLQETAAWGRRTLTAVDGGLHYKHLTVSGILLDKKTKSSHSAEIVESQRRG